jgi:hypothetical protein
VSDKIKVEIYSNFKFFFLGIFTFIATIAEALYAEKEMNVDRFSGMSSALNFTLEDGDINVKTKNSNVFMMTTLVFSRTD